MMNEHIPPEEIAKRWVGNRELWPDEKEYVDLMVVAQRGLDRYWYEHVQRMKRVQSNTLYPQRESKPA
jgi:hypothetical protein